MGIMAFTPMGNTVTFTATSTPPTPVLATSSIIGATQYKIVIPAGSSTVFIGYGPTAAAATAGATAITSSGNAFVMLAGTDQIITLNANQYFTGVTDTGTAKVYIISGDGL